MKELATFSLLAAVAIGNANAQTDTSFTYQGSLSELGMPANGMFDMQARLYSAVTGGTQVGLLQNLPNVPVVDGLFTIDLDFTATSFNGSQRWLEISVNGFPMLPRQPITRSPYALQTRGIYVDNNKLVGIGTTTPQASSRLTVIANGQSRAIHAVAGAANAPTIYGQNGNVLGEVFRADGTADVTATGGGVIVVGQDNDFNLGIDRNEIMARFNGAPSDLFFNLEGGNTQVGGRLGVGVDPGFAQLRINDTDPGVAFGLEVETSQQAALPSIIATNLAGGPALWVKGDSDVSLAGGGLLVAGEETGFNLSIDRNEIMARNNGQASDLHLNLEGGNVTMGAHAIKPAFAYGKIDLVGGQWSIVSGSSNIVGLTTPFDGTFMVELSSPVASTDVIIATDATSGGPTIIQANPNAGKIEISCWSIVSDWFREPVSFVVFRP